MSELVSFKGWLRDKNPTKSAESYKELSDALWSAREARVNEILATVESPLDPVEARDAINETLGNIDDRFVISGAGRAIKLTGEYPEIKSTLTPELLSTPLAVLVGTYNWDDRYGKSRYVYINGQGQEAELLDGHIDYHREMFAQLYFGDGDTYNSRVSYRIRRNQAQQGSRVSLDAYAWHYHTAVFGATEGDVQHSRRLSGSQEIAFLDTLKKVGGIALD